MLFVSFSGSHCVLHSFPTRRSSDLWSTVRMTSTAGRPIFSCMSTGMPRPLSVTFIQLSFSTVTFTRVAYPRSEEHTSELQSRFDLVCRLLLEKKKDPGSSVS